MTPEDAADLAVDLQRWGGNAPTIEAAEREISVLPENAETVQVWLAVQTQWRVGMAGATGLDYPGVWIVLRHGVGVKTAHRRTVFEGLQIMEQAVLTLWAEQRRTESGD